MNITSFHGVGAYRGQRNPVALRRQIDAYAAAYAAADTERLRSADDCRAMLPPLHIEGVDG